MKTVHKYQIMLNPLQKKMQILGSVLIFVYILLQKKKRIKYFKIYFVNDTCSSTLTYLPEVRESSFHLKKNISYFHLFFKTNKWKLFFLCTFNSQHYLHVVLGLNFISVKTFTWMCDKYSGQGWSSCWKKEMVHLNGSNC